MLWEVEIRPLGKDRERERVCDEFDLLTHSDRGGTLVSASGRGYLLALGGSDPHHVESFARDYLLDPVVESLAVRPAGTALGQPATTVLLKPGVTDPAAESVGQLARQLGHDVMAVRSFRRYYHTHDPDTTDHDLLTRKVLANAAIEQTVAGSPDESHLSPARPKDFTLVEVPLAGLTGDELVAVSRRGQLALDLDEMRAIAAHFDSLGRAPTDCELETLAQTWSEHCSHKTLKGAVEFVETLQDGSTRTIQYGNLLKETIFHATQSLRARWGADDWCVSVFSDNAGVVAFTADFHLAIKVETHNRPSAIEPYGGANTGLGGVIRDVLGTCLGGKPVANTDVFCLAPPDTEAGALPPGVLHPRRVLHGVVAGVRDYGNRMGIPTVNGSLYFDDRYLANPLVFCGTVGLVPRDRVEKRVRPGDYVVALGGRTGRDGIHGATFSSLGLTAESDAISGGAVQIGHAIQEKMVHDIVLAARDRNLFTAITDCGAGGFSSAIGEMAADLGAVVHLERAPLKYPGLTYTEIWISESQERMVLSVPPEHWPALEALAASEGVEAVHLGEFVPTGRLELFYQGHPVASLDMHFLHDGRPERLLKATYRHPTPPATNTPSPRKIDNDLLKAVLSSYTVCSKETIVRQYDHEVQGGTVVKPLVGVADDGPGDAAVVAPVLGLATGFALGHGIAARMADLDAYQAACHAIDEAVRNVVAVGADPARIAVLDNFCWGNVSDPEQFGGLVMTARACHDVALAYQTPFVSGKDSLNNEFRAAGHAITIPQTLLVTSLGLVRDITRCVTMDLKGPGHDLYLVGITKHHLGRSEYARVVAGCTETVSKVELEPAPKLFAAVHRAIQEGLVLACHDLSEGGLAVAVAEMAFSGGVGADVTGLASAVAEPGMDETAILFSESATRFLIEVDPPDRSQFEAVFAGLPAARVGVTTAERRLRVADFAGEWAVWATLIELKDAWQKPLRW